MDTAFALYTHENIETLPRALPNLTSGQREYLYRCVRDGPARYVEGANFSLAIARINAKYVPIAAYHAPQRAASSHHRSPARDLLLMMRREAPRVISSPLAARSVCRFISALVGWWDRRIRDRVVYINHWIDSHMADYELGLEERDYRALIDHLRREYPTHVIAKGIFYSEAASFERLGCMTMPLAPALRYRPGVRKKMRNGLRGDLSLLRRSEYTLQDRDAITRDEAERVLDYLRRLHVQKHGGLYHRFKPEWVQLVVDSGVGILTLITNERAGDFDAFSLSYPSPSKLMMGFIGYDQAVDRSVGLVRLAYVSNFKRSIDEGKELYLSVLNDKFKKNRGAEVWDHLAWAFYYDHLPAAARVGFAAVFGLLRRITLQTYRGGA